MSMNWILVAIAIYLLGTVGIIVFAVVYTGLHPKDLLRPQRVRTKMQQKMESFTQKSTQFFAYVILWDVILTLFLGIGVVIWAILVIVQSTR